jgi:cold shock CspA family protein
MSDTAHAQQRRLTGKVRWFSPDKGYGFIAIDGDESRDLFMHENEWCYDRDPRPNDRVKFLMGVGKSGRPHACQVVVVEN